MKRILISNPSAAYGVTVVHTYMISEPCFLLGIRAANSIHDADIFLLINHVKSRFLSPVLLAWLAGCKQQVNADVTPPTQNGCALILGVLQSQESRWAE